MKKLGFNFKSEFNGWRYCWIVGIFLLTMVSFGCGGGGGSDSGGGNGTPQPFTVEYASLHYRNYETPANNICSGSIGLANNGAPIQTTDVDDIIMTDSSGTSVIADADGDYSTSYLWYDCSGGSCSQSGPINDSGVWANFTTLPADTYTVDIDMANGQVLSVGADFPGEVALPIITSATMQSHWNSGDLVLSWTNPVGDANWDQVDQLRIIVTDIADSSVLYIKLEATVETVTIPASLVADAEALGNGTLGNWRIQARAYDANNLNYARSYSNSKPLNPFTTEYASLQYRNYETPDRNVYKGVVGLTNDGGPIQGSDVVNISMTDSLGASVVTSADGVYAGGYLLYDCSGATCIQSGPLNDSGIWADFGVLAAENYHLQIEMTNGQLLSVDYDFPGTISLPFVTSGTMSAIDNAGNLELSWTNPTGAADWGVVDQLRVVIYDGTGLAVLYIHLSSTDNSVIVPSTLVADAQALGDGTLAMWEVQTRAHDAINLNYARGYSDRLSLP